MRLKIGTLAMVWIASTIANISIAQIKPKGNVKPDGVKLMAPKPAAMPTRVLITTDSGTMVVALYDSTPLHRDNFVSKVTEGFYDSLLFHRVINGFMIQGGDPASKNAAPGQPLGGGSAPGEQIPAEFRTTLYHKKGVLAAARTQNPEKASSNCQFYIVQGRKYMPTELGNMSDAKKKSYSTIGGTPMLDGEYTVYGEVVMGLDVIDKIASVPTARSPQMLRDRPVGDIRMYMKILSPEDYNAMVLAAKKEAAAKKVLVPTQKPAVKVNTNTKLKPVVKKKTK
jgi:cyclophilin family peptidyl-prolyl cis-trans isomerase